mmetsp:Transcript_24549/g.70867  ORF Transcript_24549/g.70867 Transcript_24549/m.70867 type:complete len:84 (+) Transcript_24549:58-309(+)
MQRDKADAQTDKTDRQTYEGKAKGEVEVRVGGTEGPLSPSIHPIATRHPSARCCGIESQAGRQASRQAGRRAGGRTGGITLTH